ncbi:MAG: cytochrome c biogenesis protein CcsA [Bacteroidetes bacterium]|nr:cytochrome c biogenesis protein CcsA [Bacteroidota bacterium]
MTVTYQGEHLLWGNIGHFAVVLAFASALLATFAYFKSTNDEAPDRINWFKTASTAWLIHSISVIMIVVSLFAIIYNHYFEYYYAWRHSSRELPVEFMISCFWEGQEGSFLLWLFWHVVLGSILRVSVSKWTPPVLSIISLCQVVLSSMLLGMEFFGKKIGSSPFELLRLSKEMSSAPIFSQADYLAKIYARDGNGLNPLLQNYWMVIHPPVLFLGFASTIVPFAYAIAGLWKKQFSDWIKPALPWTLFSLGIFGTGIMMGGMWAYESLTFGGYWAWDPVENASLIPWLILVAGLHTLLIHKSTGYSLKSTFILVTGSFLLVLYATFLTRSGILGNSSVHSFTDLGLSGQLLIFLVMFIGITWYLIIKNWKAIPSSKDEQSAYSREFWMFIGALVLLLSALQIAFTTSFPVFNKIFGSNMAPPTDVVNYYNNIQLPVAIVISILTAVSQYFKYKNSDKIKVFMQLGIYAAISLILTAVGAWWFEIYETRYVILLFATVFAIFANAAYITVVLSKKLTFGGASVAHIGFGVLLLGVLVSSSKKNVISINQSGQEFFNSQSQDSTEANQNRKANYENILLIKDKTINMAGYDVTYRGDSVVEPNHYYRVDYFNTKTKEVFRLYPNMQINPKMGNVFNPDTRHYLTKDIFTHISAVPDKTEGSEEYKNPENYSVKIGDTVFAANNAMMVIEDVVNNSKVQNIEEGKINLMLTAKIKVITVGKTYTATPSMMIENNNKIPSSFEIPELNMRIQFAGINPKNAKPIELVADYKSSAAQYIILKAVEFPYINLVWSGTVLMVFGFVLSIFRRSKEYKKIKLLS